MNSSLFNQYENDGGTNNPEYDTEFAGGQELNQYGKKIKKQQYYPSNTPSTFIVNAVTGMPYPFLVGSHESRRLFKVYDTLGHNDREGRPLNKGTKTPINPHPNHLFYDDPDQFMRHQKMTLNPELIQQWHERKAARFPPAKIQE